MSKIALYAGTFDPITYGHLDIIQRALPLIDTLIIAIAENKNKSPMLGLNERSDVIKQLMESHHKVKVMTFDNLLVDFAHSVDATLFIRGIRNSSDFHFEYQLANTNRTLAPNIETIFLLPSPEYCHISSTFVREIMEMGGDIRNFVPTIVAKQLTQVKKRAK